MNDDTTGHRGAGDSTTLPPTNVLDTVTVNSQDCEFGYRFKICVETIFFSKLTYATIVYGGLEDICELLGKPGSQGALTKDDRRSLTFTSGHTDIDYNHSPAIASTFRSFL
jgi:hypothetical protein